MAEAMSIKTPITDLLVSDQALSSLTSTARSLTKGDLLTIARLQTDHGPVSTLDIGKEIGKSDLTITDLISVSNAFGQEANLRLGGEIDAAAAASCCCTCTPCCSCSCANVVIDPIAA